MHNFKGFDWPLTEIRRNKKTQNNEYNDEIEYNRIRKESYRWTIKLAVEQFQVHYL